jgi:hypothetical protein
MFFELRRSYFSEFAVADFSAVAVFVAAVFSRSALRRVNRQGCFRSVRRRFLSVGNGATIIVCVDSSRTSSKRQTWQRYTRLRSGPAPSWRICV